MTVIYAQAIFDSPKKSPVMKYWKYRKRAKALRHVQWTYEVDLKRTLNWLELVDWIFYLHSQGLEPAALDEFIAFCGWYFPQIAEGKPN